MHIRNINASVRTVTYGSPSYDMAVEVLKDGNWTTFFRTNEMSNDYAYSELNRAVQQAIAAQPAVAA